MPGDPTFLFSGDRNWGDSYIVDLMMNGLYTLQRAHQEKVVVVEGEAKGLDTLARQKAEGLGIEVRDYPANWNRFGNSAGPIRNQEMLDEEYVNIGFLFHDDLRHSKGTHDMAKRLLRNEIPTYLISRLKGHHL